MTKLTKVQILKDILMPDVFSELNSKAVCRACDPERVFDSIDELVNHVYDQHNG